jgi:hypothetical protein
MLFCSSRMLGSSSMHRMVGMATTPQCAILLDRQRHG